MVIVTESFFRCKRNESITVSNIYKKYKSFRHSKIERKTTVLIIKPYREVGVFPENAIPHQRTWSTIFIGCGHDKWP